jgi:hypothetical protein
VNFPRKALHTLLALSIASVALLATAAPAHAHTPTVSADCAQLSVSLDSYRAGGHHGGSSPNSVTISVDGTVVVAERFGRSFARTVAFADAAVAHPWSVVVDAVDNEFDRTFSGTSTPCLPVIVLDAAAAVTVSEPSCSAPATLTLGAISNATWSTPSATTGPAAYSVTATATAGHALDDKATTRVFSGTLAGRLDGTLPPCTIAPPVPQPPAQPPVQPPVQPSALIEFSTSETVDCAAREIVTTTTTTTTGTVLDATGLAWVASTPVVTVSRTTRAIEPDQCPVAAVVAVPSEPSALARTGVDDPAPLLWLAAVFGLAGAGLIARKQVRVRAQVRVES